MHKLFSHDKSIALNTNADVVINEKVAAILTDGRVPAGELAQVEGLVVLVDDRVANVALLDLVVLLAVLGDASLDGAGDNRAGLRGSAGNSNAVVVVSPNRGARFANGRVPLDEVVDGEGTLGVDNLLAGVILLGLVELGAC